MRCRIRRRSSISAWAVAVASAGDGRDVDRAEEFGLLQALHAGRVGDADLVVAAAEAGRLPLGLEDADDHERDLLDADDLADGVFVLEQVRLDVGAEDADLGRRADHGLVEVGARFDLPLADLGVLVAAALDRGVPVLVAVDDLGPGADAGRDGLDGRAAVRDGLGVLGPAGSASRRSRCGRRRWFRLAGLTKRRFVPMELKRASTAALAPAPMLTMAMTAPTPMMMPRQVRNVRILLRARARSETRRMRRVWVMVCMSVRSLPGRSGRRACEMRRLALAPMSGSCVTMTMVMPFSSFSGGRCP